MVLNICRPGLVALGLVAAGLPTCALAQQKSEENAVTSADDAFGTSVGLESTGIYTSFTVRGFNPTDAGNARIDGIYYDPVALLTLRARTSQAIRVGFAALEYPFAAPTGIVDTQLRTAGNDFHAGFEAHRQQYGSYVFILDTQIPVLDDKLAIVAGVSHGHGKFIDGASENNYSFAVKPVIRLGSVEISPFYSVNYVRDARPRPIVVMGGDFLPNFPPPKRYYGSDWARGSKDNVNFGGTVKARITDRLSLRAGLFKSQLLRKVNYTDIFRVNDLAGNSDHIFIADPRQNLYSWSGEAQLGYRLQTGRWHHRFIAGFRARDRSTEFGGSHVEDFVGTAMLGSPDPAATTMPIFTFSPVNRSKVKQTSFMAGYIGKLDGVGRINLGLQRSSFRGSSMTQTGITRTSATEWLYNASLGIEITPNLLAYVGTQRGLEDIGSAPNRATNRNEQLPPALSRQYEAGLRWNFGKHVLLVGIFEITKPHFSFDTTDLFTEVGTVKHSGVEASFSGKFIDDRLSVLAGFMVMNPVVSGPARDLGLLGKRPVGKRGTRGRVDFNYRTDVFNGLTPTLTIKYRGTTAAISEPISLTDDRQIMIRSRVSIDIGLRQPLKLGQVPATLRVKVENLLDQKRWLAPASRTLFQSDRIRFSASLLVDF
ncbi:MAG: TonB-dependent receptor [Novosphingobium sp.]|nr:TonB-dependent receptor [Novosphingobium sp.]